jgi:cytochrome c oxidase subunit 3
MTAYAQDKYYLPHGTTWPILGSIALFTLLLGVGMLLNGGGAGSWLLGAGALLLLYMMVRWFGEVIGESQSGRYNLQVDKSFRMAMGWFIFSEVMFFAAFFGALFYARLFSLSWLGGEGSDMWTNLLLWRGFESVWPSNGPANLGGKFEVMDAWGIPALNTAILLSSGVTVTMAHHALKASHRRALAVFLFLTVALGLVFVGCQAYEYREAFFDLNLSLKSGIYGTTFFMLTGFHGLHVTLGAIMLAVIWLRCLKGHFSPDRHFAFEAVAWYWHFVDVVWLALFIFVYWL